jgi:hypothetical protein
LSYGYSNYPLADLSTKEVDRRLLVTQTDEVSQEMRLGMFKHVVVLIVMIGTSVGAEELANWSTVGKWEILVDASTGNGCLAERKFEDGTLVQIGAEPARQGGFFAAYNAEWSDIQVGATGVVKFDFGDARFAGGVVGRIRNGLPGGHAFFDNPNFVTEFAKRLSVQVSGESGRLVEIDLSGSKKAIDAVLACQKEQPEPARN